MQDEFKREFAPLEVFGIAFSIIGLLPSIASVLVFALPNGGPLAMVWGWAIANIGVLLVGISMAELASAAPTSGGVTSFSATYKTTFLKRVYLLRVAEIYWRGSWAVSYHASSKDAILFDGLSDANTIGSIATIASIDWGCAVQIAAAAAIGSGGKYSVTSAETLRVPPLSIPAPF
ncbi:hypothetical protein BDM02DRAFT_3129310 [Thelephora ganbajun]|uniref:Uncharacterized protein n=1 Tax=Thelephora ganbajun TaxID=370292 RepID=A0ACB6ZEY2_THEGA|nr:hypothetical protein BDM02DRAFT_3129310 [Thelephora ganbajun]